MGKGVGGAAPAGVVRGRGATRGGRGNGGGKKVGRGTQAIKYSSD